MVVVVIIKERSTGFSSRILSICSFLKLFKWSHIFLVSPIHDQKFSLLCWLLVKIYVHCVSCPSTLDLTHSTVIHNYAGLSV